MADVSTLEIRPRRAADVASCVEALAAVHASDRYPSVWPADPVGFLSPSDVLAAWVAVADDTIVGQVLLRDGRGERAEFADADVDLPHRLASVSRLFVAPVGRGRGAAARLLAAGVAWAERDDRTAILSVVDGEAAVGFYERLGWRLLTSRPAGWRRGDGSTPTMRYYRQPNGSTPTR